MPGLLAAAAFFVLLHLLVSGARLRDQLVRVIGQGPYMGLFSLASIGGLVWLGLAFASARVSSQNVAYWEVTALTRHLQLALQLVAIFFIVTGVTTPNPTAVRQEKTLDRPDLIKGMLRVTRHPFLWGVALWAAGHLMVNGDAASLILFGAMLALAVFGTFSIDAKRRRALGEAWSSFVSKTSNAPFAAIVAGRQTLKIGEIGWWRILLSFAVWAALAFAHPYLFGVAALP